MPTKPDAPTGPRRRAGKDIEAGAPSDKKVPATAEANQPKRILLVDDDAGVRASLGNVLESEGFGVLFAPDGERALELVATMAVDLVLLDLNMPRKNGWETFERLSFEHPMLPVIIVTARPNQLFTAVGAGAGALLEKPLDIPNLLRTVHWLLAEPAEAHLARLTGRAALFHYSAPKTHGSLDERK